MHKSSIKPFKNKSKMILKKTGAGQQTRQPAVAEDSSATDNTTNARIYLITFLIKINSQNVFWRRFAPKFN